jgi:Asp-tRNA(Asn)/Glu-tRNA(Gln) amidotransferase A subunit family amidase
VQLVGPVGADAAVLRLGRAYEEATHWVARRPPPLVS